MERFQMNLLISGVIDCTCSCINFLIRVSVLYDSARCKFRVPITVIAGGNTGSQMYLIAISDGSALTDCDSLLLHVLHVALNVVFILDVIASHLVVIEYLVSARPWGHFTH